MPAQWTADLVGEMHLKKITAKQLAAEVGWHEKYLSVVLNGHREPKGAEATLRAALLRLEIKAEREKHGLSADLDAMVERYRKLEPMYAEQLGELLKITPV